MRPYMQPLYREGAKRSRRLSGLTSQRDPETNVGIGGQCSCRFKVVLCQLRRIPSGVAGRRGAAGSAWVRSPHQTAFQFRRRTFRQVASSHRSGHSSLISRLRSPFTRSPISQHSRDTWLFWMFLLSGRPFPAQPYRLVRQGPQDPTAPRTDRRPWAAAESRYETRRWVISPCCPSLLPRPAPETKCHADQTTAEQGCAYRFGYIYIGDGRSGDIGIVKTERAQPFIEIRQSGKNARGI